MRPKARVPQAQVYAAARDPRLVAAAAAAAAGDERWVDRARCRQLDPESFFPAIPSGTVRATPAERRAQGECWSCPVQAECLAAALALRVDEGVWGGTTGRERRPMIAAWHAGASRPRGVAL